MKIDEIKWNVIGNAHTPYVDEVPAKPESDAPDDFFIEIKKEYVSGIKDLDQFSYAHILFLFDRVQPSTESLEVKLPWLEGDSIGVFATRAPNRPNPIGLSVAKVLSVQGNRIYIDAIDVFDGTPVMDIKPYMQSFDAKQDGNDGWMTKEVMRKIQQFSPSNQ
jgi:tRNA-Thr(GGU) m(6)t(6)A37 methyltransferase TsaA